jgi:AAHS family 4-hydroxybenzoate transporter-like MFS transporter
MGGLAISPLSDKFGRKIVLLVSVAAFGSFSLLPVFDLSYDRLLFYRFVTGLGLGGAISAAAALTAEYAPRRYRGLLVNLTFAGVACGGVLGGLLASRFIPLYGWQAAFWMGGLAPLGLLPVLVFWMPESIIFLTAAGKRPRYVARMLPRIDPRRVYRPDEPFVAAKAAFIHAGGVQELFRDCRRAGTLLLWVISFCSMFTFGLVVYWLPAIMTGEGLPLKVAILGPVLMNLGGVVGTIALGFLFGRLGPVVIIACGLSLASLGIAITGQTAHTTILLLESVFGAGLFLLGSINSTNALIATFYPTAIRATGVGWALGVGRIGGTIGPAIGGVLLSMKLGSPMIFLVPATVAVVGAIAVGVLGTVYPAHRQPPIREGSASYDAARSPATIELTRSIGP